jgi:hypothetical protein
MLHRQKIVDWLRVPGNECLDGTEGVDKEPLGRYRMNYTNIWDWLREYSELEECAKRDLQLITNNITMGELGGIRNWCARGMKNPRDLNMWLLFLVGLDWRTVGGWHGSLIEGNTKTEDGRYASRYSSNKILCPRTAKRASNKWLKTHRPDRMFAKGYSAYTFVVHSGNLPAYGSREKIHSRWEDIGAKLHACRKNKLWAAHFHNHEISVPSILKQQIYPHTHVLVWSKEELLMEEITERLTPYIVLYKNDVFHECSESFKRFIDYLHAIYNLANTYSLEWTPEQSVRLNIETKNLLEQILDIYWGKRKTGGGNLPGAKKKWQEDNLQTSIKKSRMN